MSSPPVGSMYLYDDITPPLLDNSYQLSVVTNVTFDGDAADPAARDRIFRHRWPALLAVSHRSRCGIST